MYGCRGAFLFDIIFFKNTFAENQLFEYFCKNISDFFFEENLERIKFQLLLHPQSRLNGA